MLRPLARANRALRLCRVARPYSAASGAGGASGGSPGDGVAGGSDGASASAGSFSARDAAPVPDGFVSKTKAMGMNALWGPFSALSGGFDSCLKGMRVDAVESGRVVASLTVDKALQNSYGTLHGGAVSTIIDVVGTMAILSHSPTKAGVSVELSSTFMAAAKADSEVVVEGRLLKIGRKLAFTEVEIRDKASGRLLATGKHTKAI